jgi:hypothetical protein
MHTLTITLGRRMSLFQCPDFGWICWFLLLASWKGVHMICGRLAAHLLLTLRLSSLHSSGVEILVLSPGEIFQAFRPGLESMEYGMAHGWEGFSIHLITRSNDEMRTEGLILQASMLIRRSNSIFYVATRRVGHPTN